jgi:NADH-quinone oxidoreductase subunit L
VYRAIYWIAIFTAFLTAFYTGRAFFMTFWGPEKLPSPDDPEAPHTAGVAAAESHGHDEEVLTGLPHHHHGEIGHESPPLMTYPLLALAGCTILIGLFCLYRGLFSGETTQWFVGHLKATLRFSELRQEVHEFSWPTAVIGSLAGLGGIGLSYLMYARPSPLPGRLVHSLRRLYESSLHKLRLIRRLHGAVHWCLRRLYESSLHKFYIDEIYQAVVVGPIRGLTVLCDLMDDRVVDRLVIGIARLPRLFGRDRLASYQNGLIQYYVAVSAVSVTALLAILLLLMMFESVPR